MNFRVAAALLLAAVVVATTAQMDDGYDSASSDDSGFSGFARDPLPVSDNSGSPGSAEIGKAPKMNIVGVVSIYPKPSFPRGMFRGPFGFPRGGSIRRMPPPMAFRGPFMRRGHPRPRPRPEDRCGKWSDWKNVTCWWPSTAFADLPKECTFIPLPKRIPDYLKNIIQSRAQDGYNAIVYEYEQRGKPAQCGYCSRSFKCRARNVTLDDMMPIAGAPNGDVFDSNRFCPLL
uniref:Uncharacterized protein n=1 Tax=Panagrellus redivivus TaxID=6233 RepID=A0A7E4V1M3_PANRE